MFNMCYKDDGKPAEATKLNHEQKNMEKKITTKEENKNSCITEYGVTKPYSGASSSRTVQSLITWRQMELENYLECQLQCDISLV